MNNNLPTSVAFRAEPGLPWASVYLRSLPEPVTLPESWNHIMLDTDVMAPRFPLGAALVVEPVRRGEALTPGVYVWHDSDSSQANIGRLGATSPLAHKATALFLSLDNRREGIICFLEWSRPGFALYRVTYYASVPVE